MRTEKTWHKKEQVWCLVHSRCSRNLVFTSFPLWSSHHSFTYLLFDNVCPSNQIICHSPDEPSVFHSIMKFAHADYFFNCLSTHYFIWWNPTQPSRTPWITISSMIPLYDISSQTETCLKRHILVCLLWNFIVCIALICVLVIPSERPFALRSEPEPIHFRVSRGPSRGPFICIYWIISGGALLISSQTPCHTFTALWRQDDWKWVQGTLYFRFPPHCQKRRQWILDAKHLVVGPVLLPIIQIHSLLRLLGAHNFPLFPRSLALPLTFPKPPRLLCLFCISTRMNLLSAFESPS